MWHLHIYVVVQIEGTHKILDIFDKLNQVFKPFLSKNKFYGNLSNYGYLLIKHPLKYSDPLPGEWVPCIIFYLTLSPKLYKIENRLQTQVISLKMFCKISAETYICTSAHSHTNLKAWIKFFFFPLTYWCIIYNGLKNY